MGKKCNSIHVDYKELTCRPFSILESTKNTLMESVSDKHESTTCLCFLEISTTTDEVVSKFCTSYALERDSPCKFHGVSSVVSKVAR